MSQAPSMPMYWDAYIADTTHLTIEEHGAYLLLLGAMWRRNGAVPDDDKDNARILGISKAKWRKIKSRLSEFLIIENGEITQKNLQKTWIKTQEKIQRNAANGAKGGRPKSNKNNGLGKANGYETVNLNDNPNESIPEPEPEPEPIDDDDKREREAAALKSGLDLLTANQEQLHQAAGVTDLNNANFMTLSEPLRWVENGCDLEMDILPTLKSVSTKSKANIGGWAYFSKAIFAAKAQRLAPAPVIQLNSIQGGQAPSKAEQRQAQNRNNITAAVRLVRQRRNPSNE